MSEASQAASNQNVVERTTSFLRESVDELKKVHKPTRQETLQATLVTMVIMVVVSVLLAIMDFVFRWVMERLI